MVHALTLLLITLFVGRWAAYIPMATLAAILVVVAYHMSEWRAFLGELHAPKSDVSVLLTTFGLTILVDLTVAISVGMVLASFLFIRRMAAVTSVNVVTNELRQAMLEEEGEELVDQRSIPEGVEVYEINGPFFFGAAATFKDTLARVAGKPKVLIIRMRHVSALDSTGMHALTEVAHRTRRDGTVVILSDVHMQPLVALTGTPAMAEIGEANVVGGLALALVRAREILSGEPADGVAIPPLGSLHGPAAAGSTRKT
jgi:SulP family sulfate permease